MSAPARLVIDARKAFDAGIGTYIRSVVPRVVDRLDVHADVLVAPGPRDRIDWIAGPKVNVVEMAQPPFGVAEQVALRRWVHASSLFWATSLAHALLPRGRIVATIHDVAQLALPRSESGASLATRTAIRLLLASLCRNAVALMAISAFTRAEFLAHVGQPARTEIIVAPLGVSPEWFDLTPQRPPGAVPYFVCVGSVRPHKNVARLEQAFGRVGDRLPHTLVVAGKLSPGEEYRSWLHELPEHARARVQFTGAIEDSQLRSLVANADALVFPSLYEGFGLPALEAMAAGCPVLASRAGALPEVCAGAAAALFDPRDDRQIAHALLDHAGRRADAKAGVIERGRQRARQFSWDATALATASVIEGALRAKREP
jgi:glycosyltransferase involved in cell wall biosynthesis